MYGLFIESGIEWGVWGRLYDFNGGFLPLGFDWYIRLALTNCLSEVHVLENTVNISLRLVFAL